MKQYRDYPPNVPRKLIKAIEQIGSQRKFAKKLNINDSYVNRLMKHGTEPTDNTEYGKEIRVKLFLPRKRVQHKTGAPKYDRPAWLYKWYRLLKDERWQVIKSYLETKEL
jgi:hypothetical protein